MMRTISLGLVLLLSAAPAAAIQSNIRPGTNIRSPEPRSDLKEDEIRRVQEKFGACVVRSRSQAAAAETYVLKVDHDDRELRKLIDKLADGDCLVSAMNAPGGAEMRLPGDTMRYTLADALVRSQLPTTPMSDLDRVARLELARFNEADFQPKPGSRPSKKRLGQLEQARNARLGANFLSAYSECVVRTDPAGSRELLAAHPVTLEEQASFRKLQPALGGCLPGGRTLSFGKGALRGAIAYSYYRLAKAPRLPVAATTGAGAKN
jgi:hypothetical protein